MKDLSHHLLDILENSAKAGASLTVVEFEWQDEWLTVQLTDNGPGFAPEVRDDPTNPFATTRVERPVGLGLALFRSSAEQTGGSLAVQPNPDGGVHLTAIFNMKHIDAKPVGNLADALTTAMAAWPDMDLLVRIGRNHEPAIDTAEVKRELDGIPLEQPKVRAYLRRILEDEFSGLTQWAEKTSGSHGNSESLQ